MIKNEQAIKWHSLKSYLMFEDCCSRHRFYG